MISTVSTGQRSTRVLIVDDDTEIRTLLAEFLEHNGLAVARAADAQGMRAVLDTELMDLVVLDINLPGINGLELCRALRADSDLPVIMLTARTSPMDRIAGLETGADDYVCKPFEPLELLSRIRSVLRRSGSATARDECGNTPARVHFGDWTLDFYARHLIDPQGVLVVLSGMEYRLLRIFLEQPNTILSRDHVMDRIHGRDSGPFDRSIDLQVSRLRQKIEVNSRDPKIIKTVRNEGYILTATVRVDYQ
jgi:two-component system, OmpR family, response regulator